MSSHMGAAPRAPLTAVGFWSFPLQQQQQQQQQRSIYGV